tara:strand:- start:6771 stop:7799 length:1029 start_codon:yes stop_codon:yes gene_type:complete
MAHPESKQNILSFLEKGKIGSTLSCRGGYGHSYSHFVFTKMNKTTIHVSHATAWQSVPTSSHYVNGDQRCEGTPCHVFITKDGIKVVNNKAGITKQYNGVPWIIGAFLSLGDFECDARKIIPVKVRFKINSAYYQCANGDFLPQKVMIFDWDGNLTNPTKANIKLTDEWIDSLRVRRNSMAKRNRDEKKAVAEFRYRRDENMLDDWDASKALSFKNAQLRQQAIEAVGLERVVGHLEAKVLDSDKIDGRPYELIQYQIPNPNYRIGTPETMWNKKIIEATYLKMTNPSTGEYHLEGIPLEGDTWDHAPEATVRCALAWRDGETNSISSKGKPWNYTEPEILT